MELYQAQDLRKLVLQSLRQKSILLGELGKRNGSEKEVKLETLDLAINLQNIQFLLLEILIELKESRSRIIT